MPFVVKIKLLVISRPTSLYVSLNNEGKIQDFTLVNSPCKLLKSSNVNMEEIAGKLDFVVIWFPFRKRAV